MATPADLVEAREFSFVSASYRYPCPVDEKHPGGWSGKWRKFVVLEWRRAEAVARAAVYCKKEWGLEGLHAIHVYSRTYIREARLLVEQGAHDGGPE